MDDDRHGHASWVHDGWAAAPEATRVRRPPAPTLTVSSFRTPQKKRQHGASKRQGKRHKAKIRRRLIETGVSEAPPLPEVPPEPKQLLPVGPFPEEDPEGWLACGWASKPGTIRNRKACVIEQAQLERVERAKRVANAVDYKWLEVGARVEARWQASVPGVASDKRLLQQTRWYPGTIEAVGGGLRVRRPNLGAPMEGDMETGVPTDGTYSIRYDDGDLEHGVRRRFLRQPSRERARTTAATAAEGASAPEWPAALRAALPEAPFDDLNSWAIPSGASNGWLRAW
jgi:hypothetical protein